MGRKNKYEEFKDGCVLTMTTNWILQNFYTMSNEDKLKVSLAIVPKSIVQKVDMKADIKTTNLLEAIKRAELQFSEN